MSNTTSLRSLVFASLVFTSSVVTALGTTGCAEDPPDGKPDGASSKPLDPVGVYEIHSSYSLVAPPAAAAMSLAEIEAATDGPDDPARYLIDRLIVRIPEGHVQVVAAAVAPYLAAYVQRRMEMFAPGLGDGLRALADGVNRIARRFGTLETLTIGRDGRARRLIHGARVEGIDIPFAPLGLADVAAEADVTFAGDKVRFGEHGADVPYGTLLHAALDRVVVGRVVTGATDLSAALVGIVDCDALGAIVSEYVGVGSPALYAGACRTALTHLAAEIYARLDAAGNARMNVAGAATAIDVDGDGPADVIKSGTWSGTVGNAALALSIFEGAVQ
jgi:hypothetical protein